MSGTSRLFAAALVLTALARLLLIPCERIERDAELRGAYQEYRYCMGIDIFCLPDVQCPRLDCMGDYLRHAEKINGRYRLLSAFERRNLLSGWRPYWHYTPAP